MLEPQPTEVKIYPRFLQLQIYAGGSCLLMTERSTQWFETVEEGSKRGGALLHPDWGHQNPEGNC